MAEQARRTKNKTVVTVEPGRQEFLITREFDAPRELVFKAHTDAELYSQWIGPSTFEYEPLPEKGHVSLEIAEFEEMPGGRTRLKTQSVFRSVADRDEMVQSGMEEGVNEGYERLDELLERISRRG